MFWFQSNFFFFFKDNIDGETRCCANITLLRQEGNHSSTIYTVHLWQKNKLFWRVSYSEDKTHLWYEKGFFFLKVSLSYKLAITFDGATCIFTSMYKEGFLAAAETSMKTVLLVTTKC